MSMNRRALFAAASVLAVDAACGQTLHHHHPELPVLPRPQSLMRVCKVANRTI